MVAVEEGHIELIDTAGGIIEEFVLDAVVIREPDGSERRFMPDRRNSNRFLAASGETGSLRRPSIDGTEGGSRYEFTTASGQVFRFFAFGDLKGKLEHTEDPNGNRVELTYSTPGSSRPTALVHSSGGSIQLTFNAGRLASILHSTGRSTSYAYDPTGAPSRLGDQSRRDNFVRLLYRRRSAHEHALRTVTDPSGVAEHFEYDARGRLSATYFDNDLGRLDFSYSSTGVVTTTDANQFSQQQFFNDVRQVARTEDASGAFVNYQYNESGQVIHETDSLGRSRSYVWCGCGSLVLFTDENGNRTTFAPGGPNNQPTSFTDARGNVTRYNYDSDGNLTETIYPDGTVERVTYDAAGNPTSSVNRRAQPTQFTFNEFGQVTQELRPDGSEIDYIYDSRQRLAEVTDTTGTTSFTYDDGDRLTRVEYPTGAGWPTSTIRPVAALR